MGCTWPDPNQVQGYVEGEFEYVASPLAGRSNRYLSSEVRASRRAIFCSSSTVRRSRPPVMKRNDGWRRLAPLGKTSKANVPLEIDAVEAQLKQAHAVLALAEENMRVKRTSRIPPERRPTGFFSAVHARPDTPARGSLRPSSHPGWGRARIRLPPRKPMYGRLEAALVKAEWDPGAKAAACAASRVDLRYALPRRRRSRRPPRPGAAPPRPNIKVRAFVSEARIGQIHPGDRVAYS